MLKTWSMPLIWDSSPSFMSKVRFVLFTMSDIFSMFLSYVLLFSHSLLIWSRFSNLFLSPDILSSVWLIILVSYSFEFPAFLLVLFSFQIESSSVYLSYLLSAWYFQILSCLCHFHHALCFLGHHPCVILLNFILLNFSYLFFGVYFKLFEFVVEVYDCSFKLCILGAILWNLGPFHQMSCHKCQWVTNRTLNVWGFGRLQKWFILIKDGNFGIIYQETTLEIVLVIWLCVVLMNEGFRFTTCLS